MTGMAVSASPVMASADENLLRKVVAGIFLATLADWLLFRHPLGISVAIFAGSVGAATILVNPVRTRRSLIGLGVLGLGAAPTIENISPLSLGLVALSLGLFAVLAVSVTSAPWQQTVLQALYLLGRAPLRCMEDCLLATRAAAQKGIWPTVVHFAGWIVPVVFTCLFGALFAMANPLIEGWIRTFDPREFIASLDALRILFWLCALAVVWPFLHVSIRKVTVPHIPDVREAVPPHLRPLFGQTVILRSLILFNVLFAAQTAMDLAYLWGGMALPDGMTYAAYAHRGAYPLVATALLAAGFVLIAMRPGRAAETSSLVRVLVFVWVAQNVLLVISSMLRLDIYVSIYSLTYWRVAAFIWMGLVATGLLLIITRVALDRSNGWLISTNLGALAVTLYACSFVNFPSFIGTYNVEHRQEAVRNGVDVDVGYLWRLGAQAIPAMDKLAVAAPEKATIEFTRRRNILADDQLKRLEDWRAWSLRAERLRSYLRNARECQATPSWNGPSFQHTGACPDDVTTGSLLRGPKIPVNSFTNGFHHSAVQ